MSEPKISVVMPAYNAEKYIAEAINSILSQTFTDFEFIIINDASIDSTKEIIESFQDSRIILINNKQNQGVANSLNIGISAARGKYIARMDADDISLPKRFQTQFDFMEQNPNIDICGTWSKTFGDYVTSWETYQKHDDIRDASFFFCPMIHPTIMFRKDLSLQYSLDFPRAEDYDIWCKKINELNFANIPEILLLYRTHYCQIGAAHQSEQKLNAKDIRVRNLKSIGISLEEKELKIYNDIFSEQFKPQNMEEIVFAIKILEKISIEGLNHGYGKIFQEIIKFYQKKATDFGINNKTTSLKLYFTIFRKLKIFKTPRTHLRYIYHCLRNLLHL